MADQGVGEPPFFDWPQTVAFAGHDGPGGYQVTWPKRRYQGVAKVFGMGVSPFPPPTTDQIWPRGG